VNTLLSLVLCAETVAQCIDDMLLFSLAVQFEHTNWSKDEQQRVGD